MIFENLVSFIKRMRALQTDEGKTIVDKYIARSEELANVYSDTKTKDYIDGLLLDELYDTLTSSEGFSYTKKSAVKALKLLVYIPKGIAVWVYDGFVRRVTKGIDSAIEKFLGKSDD